MPATATRYGRAPASRRAAIDVSAGVRTLTTIGWAHAALDDHRDGAVAVRRAASRLECGVRTRRAAQSRFRPGRRHGAPLPSIDRPQAAGSKTRSNVALETGSTGFVEDLVRPTGRGCGR